MSTVTLPSNFKVTIPLAVREALHLTAGEQLHVMPYAGRVELTPLLQMQQMRGFLRGMDTTVERN